MIDAKKYIEEIDKKQDKLTSLSDEIWGYAETAFTEFQSVEALQKFFESEGFLVWSRSLRRIRCIIRFKSGI